MKPVLPNALSPVLKPLKQYLQEHYQDRLNQVVLFGSHARQQATENSDIDILVVLDDPVDASAEGRRTSEFIAQLCLEHDLLISCLFLPTSRYQTENSPLLRNIRQEGIVL
ncbi:hypothetical protein XM38_042070 [Halomicronema hongdechloris C2206]|uniref:Polymerase nucleotidyl transferase domain-containing protein n=1 Tax=Halomicronema hongdechloris C2206 TaxID=1641165 RepID=A0A1Z3HSH2_9CYAN|nr:nucleotidyltransferase domain-containing protein [Halomicronema hongdechloris]ASC73245.1 hypothetical protein XM38_042070 [Halomicronema hongdechloris C2206]